MGLKADRNYNDGVDISFFMNVTGNRGGIVVHDQTASGSGAAMDDANQLVRYPSGSPEPSGTYPAGLLLCDVVDLDLTRTHINWHKDEIQKGGKVTLLRHGTVVTDNISGTPGPGNTAYYDSTGDLAPSDPGNSTQVGRFLSKKDADGYAKVEINIV